MVCCWWSGAARVVAPHRRRPSTDQPSDRSHSGTLAIPFRRSAQVSAPEQPVAGSVGWQPSQAAIVVFEK
eukprot:2052280-Alexandrium_andersonii.AAC.1